jgi:hypothetical protein
VAVARRAPLGQVDFSFAELVAVSVFPYVPVFESPSRMTPHEPF